MEGKDVNLQPVSTKNRIASIDILRGVSLLGILLVNIIAFYVPMPHVYDLEQWFTSVKDTILYQYIEIYVQSSFYPLFSILFGYGVAMQYKKATALQKPFYPFITKRMIVLFIIGILHAVLIWWGDILATYAFCGLFLIMFIRLNPKWLLSIATFINGIFHLFFLGLYYLMGILNEEVQEVAVDISRIQNSIAAYGAGSWVDAFKQRLIDLSVQMDFSMWMMSLFTILPYMLVGAALSKWSIIEKAKEKWKVLLVIAIIFVPLGLFIKNAPILYTRTYLLDYAQVYIGGPILALGYIAIIVLLCLLPNVANVMSPFAKMGRLSLTMYLMQSIILSVLFYRWGFGLYGKVDVELGIYIAFAIYIGQIILAELWLLKFSQGPVEMLMKKIVYGKNMSEK